MWVIEEVVLAGALSETDSAGSAVSTPFLPSLLALVQQRQALPARDRGEIVRSDPFHFGSMSSFLVARITQDHAVVIESMQVTFLSTVPGH